MKKIDIHIQKLLAFHDFVIIPGFGGLLVQQQSACVQADVVIPPLATIAFNPLLHHADGLLAVEIAKSEGIPYRKAVEILDAEVSRMKSTLSSGLQVSIENVGVFEKNEIGTLLFSPVDCACFLPQNFGLNKVYLKQSSLELRKSAPVYHLSSKVRMVRYAAAAVIVFGLLMISPQLNDVRMAKRADIFPVRFQTTQVHSLNVSKQKPSQLIDTVKIATKKSEDIKKNVIQHSAELYHVVVACLQTEVAAQNYSVELKKEKFDEAKVLSSSTSYRVSIKSFDTKESALSFMEQLRRDDERFENAWVLCQ